MLQRCSPWVVVQAEELERSRERHIAEPHGGAVHQSLAFGPEHDRALADAAAVVSEGGARRADCIDYREPPRPKLHCEGSRHLQTQKLLLVHPPLSILANVWQPVPAQALLRVLVRSVRGVDGSAHAHEHDDCFEECREWQQEVGDEDEGEDRRRQKGGLIGYSSAEDTNEEAERSYSTA